MLFLCYISVILALPVLFYVVFGLQMWFCCGFVDGIAAGYYNLTMNIDLHTHTVASGHGTNDTITDMAKEAARKGMMLLGITDHGPATPGAASVSYFMNLRYAPRDRFGVKMMYGAECNILPDGVLDLPDHVLAGLDYCIVSMHRPPRTSYSRSAADRSRSDIDANTADYIAAMQNPHVHILGHCDNTQFPVDYCRIADAAAANHIIVEVNNASLTPGGYHQVPGIDTRSNYLQLLSLCKERSVPVLLSSDSHGHEGIGEVPYAEALIREISYPEALIVNLHPEKFLPR